MTDTRRLHPPRTPERTMRGMTIPVTALVVILLWLGAGTLLFGGTGGWMYLAAAATIGGAHLIERYMDRHYPHHEDL